MLFEFQCGVCGAHYRLEDDKISDKGVKITCPKCNNFFILRKTASPSEDSMEPNIEYLAIVEELAPKPVKEENKNIPKIEVPPVSPEEIEAEAKPPLSDSKEQNIASRLKAKFNIHSIESIEEKKAKTKKEDPHDPDEDWDDATDVMVRPTETASFSVEPYRSSSDHITNPKLVVPEDLMKKEEAALNSLPKKEKVNLLPYIIAVAALLAAVIGLSYYKSNLMKNTDEKPAHTKIKIESKKNQ